jgi:alkylglycerol monooxygenase
VAAVRPYNPPMSRGAQRFAVLQLIAAILGTLPLLWFADGLSRSALLAWAGAIIATLWLTGAVMQSRVGLGTAIAVQAAVVFVGFAVAAA